MTSVKLLSPGLVKGFLKRYWPLWLAGLVALLLVAVLPAYVIVPTIVNETTDINYHGDALGTFWTLMRFEAWFYALAGSFIVANALNEHLFDSRAATFVGSLPLPRRTVFASTYATGLLVLVALPVLASLCLLPLCLLHGQLFRLARVGEWLALAMALSFVFHSFAQLACQLSGTRMVAGLIYLVIGFLAAALEVATRTMVSALVYGISASELSFTWLSPAVRLCGCVIDAADAEGRTIPVLLSGVAPYVFAACIAMLAAAWLFGRRALEAAGDGVLYTPLRKGLTYLAGLSLALLFGTLYRALSEGDPFGGLPMSTGETLVLVALLAAGAFLGALFAEMIMSRSTHVLAGCWRDGLVLVCAMLAFVGVCRADLLRVGHYVPAATEVKTVFLDCNYTSESMTIASSEGIERVCALQQNLIDYGGVGDAGSSVITVNVTYKLASGREVSRAYPIATDYPISLRGDTQASQLFREFSSIADSAEGRASRFAEVLELGEDARVEIEYYTDASNYSSVQLTGSDAAAFIEKAMAPDLREEPAGELFLGMTAEGETGGYDAAVYVYDMRQDADGTYSICLRSMQLEEGVTPHTLAWLRENHPEIQLL